MKYDLIVVGMGPSAAFLAYELIELNNYKNVLLIDQGKSVEKRVCPIEKVGKCVNCKPYCNITCGFSGAGAFSDGKLNSYHLSSRDKDGSIYLGGNDGGYFKEYFTEEENEIFETISQEMWESDRNSEINWAKESGKKETKVEIVKEMIKNNMKIEMIEKITHLTKEEIAV